MVDVLENEIATIENVDDVKKLENLYRDTMFNDHIAQEMRAQGYTGSNWKTFYRGENRKYDESTAGLFRKYHSLAVENEYDYIQEVLKKCHKSFDNDSMNTLLDNVAKIQHYSGLTRLLDFSQSFLIALFFASFGKDKEDGAVYRFSTDYINMKGIETCFEKQCFENYITYCGNSRDDLKKHFSRNEIQFNKACELISKNHFIELNPSSPRMDHQQGLFLWMGEDKSNMQVGKKGKSKSIEEKNGRGKEYPGLVRKISVKAGAKKYILEYLKNEKKIDKDFIYSQSTPFYWDKDLEEKIIMINKKSGIRENSCIAK